MLKRLAGVLSALVLTAACTLPNAAAVSTSATAAILMDAGSGRVLYAHNPDRRMLIASTTKLMTALVALRDGRLTDLVTVSRNAAYTEGSSMYLKEGEQLTLEALLYGLLLCSGNDAAVAIAEHIAGSEQAFAQRMNALAAELGMGNSSFANPSGLDAEGHYSTARDMAHLGCAFMEQEVLCRIASTRSVTVAGRTMTNHNKLLKLVEGCVGLKTGYTKAAGRTLVSCVERDGRRLVAVTLQDGNDWNDHAALYEYGFSAYTEVPFAKAGQMLTAAPVSGGVQPTVPLLSDDAFSWPVLAGERADTKLRITDPLTAPISAGTPVGEAIFTVDGTEIGRVTLRTGRAVLPKLSTALATLKYGIT